MAGGGTPAALRPPRHGRLTGRQRRGEHKSAAQPRSPNGYSTAGIVLGSIAFLFLPIILGPAGLTWAPLGSQRGKSRATVAMVVSGAGTVAGMILGIIVFRALA